MNPAEIAQPASEQYANRIDELREEIRHAMAAIAANKLHTLEESLWRQEVLCTGLKHLARAGQAAGAGPALGERVQASLAALQQLNQSYAALLKRAQASNHLLLILCQGHRQQTGAAADPAMSRYSLEV